MESLLASSTNLFILIAILFIYLRKPIREFVLQRHQFIRGDVETVRVRLAQAQEKYNEFSTRLHAIDAEISVIRDQTKNDILAIKQKITTDAKHMASNVIADAKNAAEGLYSELKGQLYSELGSKVLERAEHLLRERLTQEDRARIRKEVSTQMGSIS